MTLCHAWGHSAEPRGCQSPWSALVTIHSAPARPPFAAVGTKWCFHFWVNNRRPAQLTDCTQHLLPVWSSISDHSSIFTHVQPPYTSPYSTAPYHEQYMEMKSPFYFADYAYAWREHHVSVPAPGGSYLWFHIWITSHYCNILSHYNEFCYFKCRSCLLYQV